MALLAERLTMSDFRVSGSYLVKALIALNRAWQCLARPQPPVVNERIRGSGEVLWVLKST